MEDPRYLSPPIVDEENYIAETYNLAVLPYEGVYVGFVLVFNPAGAIPPPQMNFTGLNQTELAVSRDLLRWRRLCGRELFLSVEPWDGQAFATQQILVCGSPIVRDDAIWVYYNACRFRGHKELFPEEYHPYFKAVSAMCLAKLRRDGFVSLDAAEEGNLLPRPLCLGDGSLHGNVSASQGELRAVLALGLRAGQLDPVQRDRR